MSDWVGFAGAMVGAGVGFIALRWQHQAQKFQQIRTKCADLIYIGDQYEASKFLIDIPSHLGNHDSDEVQDLRLAQMEAIVRYLELTAGAKTYRAVIQYWRGIEGLSWLGQATSSKETVEHNYAEARKALMKALKR
jgi:hypothetical protein